MRNALATLRRSFPVRFSVLNSAAIYLSNRFATAHKKAMGGKLQPAHQALNNRPVHRRYQKARCYKRHKPSRTSSPTECFEAVQDDPIEDPDQLDTGAVPAPSTPPFPPPAAVSNENSADLHDVILLIESLHKALGESHLKIEGLLQLQQTSTLLATQHEAMTASISSCKQQMDVLGSLLRQGTPDWSQ